MDPINAAVPPSYSAATGQHSSLGGELSFVDFVPQCLVPGALLRLPVFEPFNVLIDRANAWLQQTPNWEVKTCESVEFKAKHNDINFEKMAYIEYQKVATLFIRGLRLWIVPRADPSRPPQQIGYMNVVPQELPGGDLETLDLVLDRLNKHLMSNPIQGRILTVETQEMKVPFLTDFDPNTSLFYEKDVFTCQFFYVFRVFYETSEPANEVIGLASFVPTELKKGSLLSIPVYEPFSSVINNAFQWCSQQTGLRFCNAQSLEIMVMNLDYVVDTQRMFFHERKTRRTPFVRILRLAYTKSLPNSVGFMPSNAPALNLTCKTFLPAQTVVRTLGVPEYETLSQTKQRITAWVKATGARVVSAETCAVRIFGMFGVGPDASFTLSSGEGGGVWMFIVRLYLDGFYPDPPAEVLPPLPVIQKVNNCTVL